MVNVLVDPALIVAEAGDIALLVRFADEVPKYTPVIFALLIPVFLMVTLMVEAVGQDTFSWASITPACCVCVPVNVITQA